MGIFQNDFEALRYETFLDTKQSYAGGIWVKFQVGPESLRNGIFF